jgi:hypothetical protein
MNQEMKVEDWELYKQNFEYGKLQGRLESIARFNDKTDHGHSFDLNRYAKKENLKASVEPGFKNYCKDYKLTKIENPQEFLLVLLRDDWFFNYQNSNEYHLIDKGNNFSLSHSEWKTGFVTEFIKLLFDVLKPTGVYKVEMTGQIGYYANRWENIAFETEENNLWDYMLNLEQHD